VLGFRQTIAACHAEFAGMRRRCIAFRAMKINGITAFDAELGIRRIFKQALPAFHGHLQKGLSSPLTLYLLAKHAN
jgi:hypothetical protein